MQTIGALVKDALVAVETARQKANQTIPENKIKEWFQNHQPNIELLLQNFPELGYLHVVAYRGAQLNPLAPGQEFKTSQWYRRQTGASPGQASHLEDAVAWLFDPKTVQLPTSHPLQNSDSETVKNQNPTANNISTTATPAEKQKILKQRRQIIRQQNLNPEEITQIIREIKQLPAEIKYLDTAIVQHTLGELAEMKPEVQKTGLTPLLRENCKNAAKEAGIVGKTNTQNRAYLREHADGGATLYMRMDAQAHIIFKAATAPYLDAKNTQRFPDGRAMAEGRRYIEKLGDAIVCVMQKCLIGSGTAAEMQTPENNDTPVGKLRAEITKTRQLGELTIIMSRENYCRYLEEDHVKITTLGGTVLDAVDARQIGGTKPQKIVIRDGTKTYLAGAPPEKPQQRLASSEQRYALAVRHPYCAYPGCNVPAIRCQANHIIPWQRGGKTVSENMVLVCPKHHAQVDDSHSLPGRGHFELDTQGYPVWVEHGTEAREISGMKYNPFLLGHYRRMGWQPPA